MARAMDRAALVGGILSFALSPAAPREIQHLVGGRGSRLRLGAARSLIGEGLILTLDGAF